MFPFLGHYSAEHWSTCLEPIYVHMSQSPP